MWYLVNEFGVTIHHSDTPTVAMVPFFYAPSQTVFSVFWPLRDLEKEGKTHTMCIDRDTQYV